MWQVSAGPPGGAKQTMEEKSGISDSWKLSGRFHFTSAGRQFSRRRPPPGQVGTFFGRCYRLHRPRSQRTTCRREGSKEKARPSVSICPSARDFCFRIKKSLLSPFEERRRNAVLRESGDGRRISRMRRVEKRKKKKKPHPVRAETKVSLYSS